METGKKEKIIYLTGIFDGEGCVLIVDRKPRNGKSRCYDVCCTVNMIDWQPIKLLKEIYGGYYGVRKKSGNHLAAEWKVVGRKAKYFLESIKEFSMVKKPQIEMALEFINNCKNKKRIGCYGVQRKLSIEELNTMASYKSRLSQLKQIHN